MQGGAWQSDVYDDGRDLQKTKLAQAAGGTPPAMHNPSPASMGNESREFGVIAVWLRSALILVTLIAFSVMAANKESFYEAYYGEYSTSYYKSTFKFSTIKAFVGLLSVDVIVFVYAVVQLVLCFVQVSTTGSFVSSPTACGSLITFVLDSVLAYTLIAAAGAAADSKSILADDNYCDALPGFCRKAEASIAMSFFAFALLAMSVALYPIRLLRLQSK